MMRSLIRSCFDSAADNAFLLVILSAILLLIPAFHLSAFFLCVVFLFVSSKERTIAPILILACFLIPFPSSNTSMEEGRVVEVKQSYVIVKNNHSSLIVYTDLMPVYDSVIHFDGKQQELIESKGFFRFPFVRYCRLKGITHSISPNTIYEVKPSHSLRGLLMKRIRNNESEQSAYLMNVLFHLSGSEESFQGLFKDRGISLAGILVFADCLLRMICYENTRKKARFLITVFLAVLYHAPFIILYRLFRSVMEFLGIERKTSICFSMLICLRIYPSAVYTASFLMPLVYSFVNKNADKETSLLYGMHASSILFHTVNPIELLLFRLMLPISGFCWICGMGEALFHVPLHGIVIGIDSITSVLKTADLPGTLIGFGLPFYVILQILFRKKKHSAIIIFLVFQCFGLFHPFSEITFINVGQGDSMLVRSPFRMGDVLIDTGKPSQKNNVCSFLEAKGIRRLDTLLITHSDNDHSGNQEVITESFNPKHIITAHHKPFRAGLLQFSDLNDIVSDDENESSIVDVFILNGMNVLLMGDSSANTEERIIKRYPGLHADLLKLSHHGSNTGTSERFLDTVRPAMAIVSSGAYQIYHHPSTEVVERLNKRRIPYFDTKEEGDITFLCFPGFNLLITASGKIAIIRV